MALESTSIHCRSQIEYGVLVAQPGSRSCRRNFYRSWCLTPTVHGLTAEMGMFDAVQAGSGLQSVSFLAKLMLLCRSKTAGESESKKVDKAPALI